MNEPHQHDGFTLVEVLVALTVLSVSLATLLSIFSNQLDRLRQAQSETLAASLAQSVLATAGVSNALTSEITEGNTDDGYSWRLDVSSYGTDSDQEAWQIQPKILSVTVSWDEGNRKKSVKLTSLRIGKNGALP